MNTFNDPSINKALAVPIEDMASMRNLQRALDAPGIKSPDGPWAGNGIFDLCLRVRHVEEMLADPVKCRWAKQIDVMTRSRWIKDLHSVGDEFQRYVEAIDGGANLGEIILKIKSNLTMVGRILNEIDGAMVKLT